MYFSAIFRVLNPSAGPDIRISQNSMCSLYWICARTVQKPVDVSKVAFSIIKWFRYRSGNLSSILSFGVITRCRSDNSRIICRLRVAQRQSDLSFIRFIIWLRRMVLRGGKQFYFADFDRSLSSIHSLACCTTCFSASLLVGNIVLCRRMKLLKVSFSVNWMWAVAVQLPVPSSRSIVGRIKCFLYRTAIIRVLTSHGGDAQR